MTQFLESRQNVDKAVHNKSIYFDKFEVSLNYAGGTLNIFIYLVRYNDKALVKS